MKEEKLACFRQPKLARAFKEWSTKLFLQLLDMDGE
jgi:hypothetical protein